jgi:hypothetical protein
MLLNTKDACSMQQETENCRVDCRQVACCLQQVVFVVIRTTSLIYPDIYLCYIQNSKNEGLHRFYTARTLKLDTTHKTQQKRTLRFEYKEQRVQANRPLVCTIQTYYHL